MSDADMHHYCRQLATSCFEPALRRTVDGSLGPTWDHLKLLSEAPNSAIFSCCADKRVSICEQHNKTHQDRHLQWHVTLTHHDKLLLNFTELYIYVTLQILSMTCVMLPSPVISWCKTYR